LEEEDAAAAADEEEDAAAADEEEEDAAAADEEEDDTGLTGLTELFGPDEDEE
jgi:hypothetical protein